MTLKVFVGWDAREQSAYDVCVYSLKKYSSIHLDKPKDNLIDDDINKEDLFSLLREFYNKTLKLEEKSLLKHLQQQITHYI